MISPYISVKHQCLPLRAKSLSIGFESAVVIHYTHDTQPLSYTPQSLTPGVAITFENSHNVFQSPLTNRGRVKLAPRAILSFMERNVKCCVVLL